MSDNHTDKGLAILILAHKSAEQIARLVKRCQHPFVQIWIHVDRKWKTGKEELSALIPKEWATVIDRQFSVYLDDRSLIDATMELLKEALCAGGFRYYALLSGQDYPIRPIGDIAAYLDTVYPTPLIDCTPYTSDNWIARKLYAHRIFSRVGSNMKRGILRTAIRAPFVSMTRLYAKTHPLKRKFDTKGYQVYGGSAWWILPDRVAEEIVDRYRQDDDLSRLLLKAITPEEIYFQTMLMNGKYAGGVAVNPPDQVEQSCPTFAYFRPIGKPFTGHPYIFTEDDVEVLERLRFTHLFARKFDITYSAKILDWIDSESDKAKEEN